MALGALSMTRRNFVVSAMSVGSAFATLPQAFAKIPQTGRAAPAFYRTKIGDIEVTTLYDGEAQRPLTDAYVRNAPLAEVQRASSVALRSSTVTETPFTFAAVNTGDKFVLIDCGSGGEYIPGVSAGPANMAAAGIEPQAVDLVVISHFHGDHTFGLATKDGTMAFPNAEILVPEIEYAFLKGSDSLPDFKLAPLNSGAAGARKRLELYGDRVRPYRAGQELSPGIIAMATPGHSPGHMSIRISSGREQMLILGDVVTLPHLFVPHPGWHMFLDMDPALAATTRLRVLDEVASDRILVAGTHFPFPALGHIAKRGDGYEYLPDSWKSKL